MREQHWTNGLPAELSLHTGGTCAPSVRHGRIHESDGETHKQRGRNGLGSIEGNAEKSIISQEGEERRHLRKKPVWTAVAATHNHLPSQTRTPLGTSPAVGVRRSNKLPPPRLATQSFILRPLLADRSVIAPMHKTPLDTANLPPSPTLHHDPRFAVHQPLAIPRRSSPVLNSSSKILFAGFAHNVPGKHPCAARTVACVNHAIWISSG
jgi:hypothetical protein